MNIILPLVAVLFAGILADKCEIGSDRGPSKGVSFDYVSGQFQDR